MFYIIYIIYMYLYTFIITKMCLSVLKSINILRSLLDSGSSYGKK